MNQQETQTNPCSDPAAGAEAGVRTVWAFGCGRYLHRVR
jgi:hypothetical protein